MKFLIRDKLAEAGLLETTYQRPVGRSGPGATGKVRATLGEVARDLGREVGTAFGDDVMAALRGCGYRPRTSAEGIVELENCPFHRLAREHQELVCGLNLCLVEGVIAGSGHPRAHAVLSPRPGRCCVVVHGR